MIVPAVPLVRVTVYGPAPDPVTPVTLHPVALPVIAKSPAARPLTASLKVREYAKLVSAVGEAGGVKADTDGAVRSTVTVAAVLGLAGRCWRRH